MASLIINYNVFHLVILILLNITYCKSYEEKEDANYKKKLLELLYDVDAPKVNATQEYDTKQNIILFVTNIPKEMQGLDELKSKFQIHGYVEGNDEKPVSGFGGAFFENSMRAAPLESVGGGAGAARLPPGSEGCDTMLENSIASLLGWASTARGMTTGLVRIEDGTTETTIRSPGAESLEHMYEDVQFVPSAEYITKKEHQGEVNQQDHDDSRSGENIQENEQYEEPNVVYDEKAFEHVPHHWQVGEYTPLQDYMAHAIASRGTSALEDAKRDILDYNPSEHGERLHLVRNEYKRETYYDSSPARKNLIKPNGVNFNRYNKYNVFDMLRESFLDKFLNTVGLPASVTNEMAEMDNFDADNVGNVRPPSYYQLVRDALRSVRSQSERAGDNGYLLTIKGGRPEDNTDFIETLKYVMKHAPLDKTLIVVTGSCPRYGSDAAYIANRGSRHYKGPERIPYYATGPRSNELENFKRLYELPRAIKNALSKPIESEDDSYEKVPRSIQSEAPQNNDTNGKVNRQALRTEKIDAYRKLIFEQQKKVQAKKGPIGAVDIKQIAEVEFAPDTEANNGVQPPGSVTNSVGILKNSHTMLAVLMITTLIH